MSCWYFSFYFISVASFDFMLPVDEHVFRPIISFNLLCITVVLVEFILFVESFLLYLHEFVFLMLLLNILYSVQFLGLVCCLFSVISRMSTITHFFLSRLTLLGMISFTDVNRASLICFSLNSQLLPIYYIFFNLCQHSCLFSCCQPVCNLGFALVFFNFLKFPWKVVDPIVRTLIEFLLV